MRTGYGRFPAQVEYPYLCFMMQRLSNRVAIITGGARGIGLATVEKFLREGATVAIWDVDEQRGRAAVERLAGEAFPVRFTPVDTTDASAVRRAAGTLHAELGRIDILINNAGITRDATLQKMTAEQWQQVLDVNLTGVFNCTQAVAPHMVAAGYGRIVNASSIVGIQGNFGQSNYVATKAGLIGLTKVWAREFGRHGITVNAVAPGFIATDMVAGIPEKVLDGFREKIPLRRMGDPAEVANLYCFLASEEAAYISGDTIRIDGGASI